MQLSVSALALALVLGAAGVAHAQLVVTAPEVMSPTHGGEWEAMEARLHVENPTSRAITIRVDVLELIDASGAVQRFHPMRLARAGGNAQRTLRIAPGEHVDLYVSPPPDATAQVAYHVAYRQVLVLSIGGHAQRIERAGVLQFRPDRAY